MRIRRLLVAGALAAGGLATTPVAHAAAVIQPGMFINTAGIGCTMNFIFDGTGSKAGKVYGGTAAHCVTSVGADVRNDTNEVFGDVAAFGDQNIMAADWAIIEIRPAFYSRVSAKVIGNTAYPTGYTVASDTTIGDLIQISGHGMGFDVTNVTRERRVAVMTADNSSNHDVVGPLIFGDSGGPLVHIKTGKAFGLVSRLCVGTCTEEGPTIEGMLAKALTAGFPLQIRT